MLTAAITKTLRSLSFLAAAFAFASAGAWAAPCTVNLSSTDPDGRVTDATHCGQGAGVNPTAIRSALNDLLNPGGLGLTWTYIDKDPDETTPLESALSMVPGTTGTWVIDRDVLPATYNRFILTLKNGAPLSQGFLWFLVDTSAGANVCSPSLGGNELCGTYEMYGDNGNRHFISNMNLFAATQTRQLPEPGSVALLALVLGGIGLASRRRR